MGLMLLECALGLVELALLHLLAHSAYKAHAFLSAGSAVHQHVQRALVVMPPPSWRQWLLSAALAVVMVLAVAAIAADWHDGVQAQPLSGWLLLAVALTGLLALRGRDTGWLPAVGLALLLALLYSVLKTLMLPLTGGPDEVLRPALLSAADLWVAALFLLLGGLWWALRWGAHWLWVQRLSVSLFAGLYLDEWFTRTTLRLWPARLPVRANPKQSPLKTSNKTLATGRQELLP